MTDLDKTIEGLREMSFRASWDDIDRERNRFQPVVNDALELLKEQQAESVDAFIQWCADSHMIGDATLNGIKYWVEKYKEFVSKGR